MKERIEKALGGIRRVSDEDSRRWDYENVVVPHLRASGLPMPYWARVRDTTWHPDQRSVYEKARELLNGSGAIVVLVGPRGTGKTTIASQLILDRAWDDSLAMPWHRRPPYRKAHILIQKFKALYSDFGSRNNEDLMTQFNDYCELHPLFVIDEWHECEDMKVHDRLYTDFLDRRYSNNLDSLIISNQSPEEFMSSTNESTLSRMQESGEIILCDWPSFRIKP